MVGPVVSEPESPRTVVRSAAGMGAGAAASRVFGAVRVLVIAAVLGTTYLGNAFQGANTFSTVLFELLAAGALSAVLVPTFVAHLDRGDQADAEHLAGGVLGVAMVAMGVVCVIGMACAPWLADLLTSAVDDPAVAAEQRDLTSWSRSGWPPVPLPDSTSRWARRCSSASAARSVSPPS
jgi:putative peptidoglycan lipid II flippase